MIAYENSDSVDVAPNWIIFISPMTQDELIKRKDEISSAIEGMNDSECTVFISPNIEIRKTKIPEKTLIALVEN